jgi:hypothetical protein
MRDHAAAEALLPGAEVARGLFAASREGEFAAVDRTLGTLLGRPPLTIRDVLQARLRNDPTR